MNSPSDPGHQTGASTDISATNGQWTQRRLPSSTPRMFAMRTGLLPSSEAWALVPVARLVCLLGVVLIPQNVGVPSWGSPDGWSLGWEVGCVSGGWRVGGPWGAGRFPHQEGSTGGPLPQQGTGPSSRSSQGGTWLAGWLGCKRNQPTQLGGWLLAIWGGARNTS